ncbi:hypothetical protein EEDFHM_03847 [Methylorubrum populi]
MSTTPKFNRSAILGYAWTRARAAAVAAGQSVRLHIGAAMRAAWSEAKAAVAAMVPQPVQQQQAQAGLPGAGACEVCGRPLTDPVSIEAGIGPICRAAGHSRRQLGLFDNPSDYRIELAGDVICVTDLDRGGASVTNDAAGVIRDLVEAGHDLSRMPVIYRDSTGTWDELVVKDGRFAGFRHLDTARKEALRAIAKGLDVPPVEMIQQPVQQQQACAGDTALAARRAAVVAAGMVVEPHPRRPGWKVGFGEALTGEKPSCTVVNTEEQAVGMAEEMLADFRGQQPAPAQEPVKASAPDLTTAEGLAEALAGRTATMQMQGGEAVYRVVEVKRWTSPDGSRVRDYITLASEGMASDDRKGPAGLFVERAGGGRGTYLDTAAGRVWWGYGGFCDSGAKRGRADDLVKDLLAPLSGEGSL